MKSTKTSSNKRDALIVAKKAAHEVLLFGNKVFGELDETDFVHQNARIDLLPFPSGYSSLKRLANYTLVILDYSAFIAGNKLHNEPQEVFAKQMIEALDAGTTFCFVHNNEDVPEEDKYSFQTGHMRKDDIDKCLQRQIAFRWLKNFSIRPIHNDNIILSGEISRNEFKVFLDKWGASHNVFHSYGEGKFDDIIIAIEDFKIGFTIIARKGRIVFLPFQRDFSRLQDLKDGLHSLIDCLLTYISKSIIQTPLWGNESFFNEESLIRCECKEIEDVLEKALARLRPFEEAKALLFQSEYTLERSVPVFISSHLEILTEREEKYKEDFWLLNDKQERIVIAEVKSVIKGFKKSAIFSLFNHREENKLDESFPALLIVNCNLQAGSWNDKDRKIDKQDYEVAAQNNILILRVEDLVRLWDAVRTGLQTSEYILGLLKSKKGWLQVDQNLEIHEFK